MEDLRSVAAFFRCSLNEAVRFMTDEEAPRLIFSMMSDPLYDRRGGW